MGYCVDVRFTSDCEHDATADERRRTQGADVCFCMSLCENAFVPAKHCMIPAMQSGGSDGAVHRGS